MNLVRNTGNFLLNIGSDCEPGKGTMNTAFLITGVIIILAISLIVRVRLKKPGTSADAKKPLTEIEQLFFSSLDQSAARKCCPGTSTVTPLPQGGKRIWQLEMGQANKADERQLPDLPLGFLGHRCHRA